MIVRTFLYNSLIIDKALADSIVRQLTYIFRLDAVNYSFA